MRHSSRVGSGTMPRFTMVAQRRRSESNRRIEVLQTSALPLGYGAARRKLAISLDFLNPPREVLPTSLSLRRAAPAESRTAEIAGLPSPLEEYALSQESVWGFLWVLVVRQAHCGSSPNVHPQARAPDPIVDLAAGPLEPGLEAWVVPHLVVDPRGDEVGLPPTDETACPRVADWSSAGPIAPQRSNHIVLQRAFFLSSILSWTGPPNLVNTRAISSSNLEGNSFRIGDRARVLNGRARSASSRADVGEKPLAVLRHLPDRRGWRHSLVVTRTPHNHLDQHGREGEPLWRKPID